MIAVNDFDWNSLTSNQEKAVLSWVKEGGTLLFGTGEPLDRTLGRMKKQLLGEEAVSTLTRTVNLTELLDEKGGEELPVELFCADFSVKGGRKLSLKRERLSLPERRKNRDRLRWQALIWQMFPASFFRNRLWQRSFCGR